MSAGQVIEGGDLMREIIKTSRFLNKIRFLTFYIAAGLGTSFVHAELLEEIVVTAQKRGQNLQDVGIAVTAYTGEQLKELGISRSVDVTNITPGVHTGGAMAGQNTQFTVRGVTQIDFNDIVESPNAVYLDEGYMAIANAQSFALFDIDRVEILKGPQGTLFGRNATGGLVHFVSNRPNYEEVEGYVDISAGQFDVPTDANLYTVEAAINTPIGEKAAARLAVRYNRQDALLENNFPQGMFNPGPGAGEGADLGDDDTQSARLTLAFQPNDMTEITISGNYSTSEVSTGPYQSKPTIAEIGLNPSGQPEVINVLDSVPTETRWAIVPAGHNEAFGLVADPFTGADFLLPSVAMDQFFGGPNGGRITPGGDFFGYLDPDGDDFTFSSDFAFKDQGSMDTSGLHLDIDMELSSGINFKAITDFKKYEKLLFIDVDAAPANQLANYAGVDATSFTQEFRWSGTNENSRWVAGLFYLNIDNESDNGLKAPNPYSIASFPLDPDNGDFAAIDVGTIAEMETNSYSAFGQYEYDLSDELTLIAGFRVIQEEKDFEMTIGIMPSLGISTINVPQNYIVGPIPFEDDSSDTLWAGKVQLDWKPNDETLVYAGINRGVKAGSYNAPLMGGYFGGGGDAGVPYDEEILLSYEAGFKTEFHEGRTRLNGTAYYYDYEDYQAFLFVGVGGVVLNADAKNYGFELELITSPVEGLDLLISGAWLDATVKDVPLSSLSQLPPNDVNPTYAPEFQATALIRYEWAVGNGTMSIQADASYSDESYYNLRNFDADKFDDYTLVNARIGWTNAEGNVKLALEMRNISDERAGDMGYDLATLCGCNEVSYKAPRYVGLQTRYSF